MPIVYGEGGRCREEMFLEDNYLHHHHHIHHHLGK